MVIRDDITAKQQLAAVSAREPAGSIRRVVGRAETFRGDRHPRPHHGSERRLEELLRGVLRIPRGCSVERSAADVRLSARVIGHGRAGETATKRQPDTPQRKTA